METDADTQYLSLRGRRIRSLEVEVAVQEILVFLLEHPNRLMRSWLAEKPTVLILLSVQGQFKTKP
jgi:hypothetical protein